MMMIGRGGDDSCLEWSTGFLISYSINASSFSIGSIPDGFVWTETLLLFLTLLSNVVSELGCVGEWRASDLLQQRLFSAVHQSHASQTAPFVSALAERESDDILCSVVKHEFSLWLLRSQLRLFSLMGSLSLI